MFWSKIFDLEQQQEQQQQQQQQQQQEDGSTEPTWTYDTL